VGVLRTEVDWAAIPLLRFFQGHRPAERGCLDLDLAHARER